MNNIAIIPARSGSKGLRDKNIKELNGKPLLAYSIEAALKSKVFDTVMVSTDSEKYADIAREYGAAVPFLRSTETASDNASSWDAVLEVLQGYSEIGRFYDTFCLLQPTSPLRTAEDIRNAYTLFGGKDAKAVVSVAELEHPLEWCGIIDESLSLDGFIDEAADSQRQGMSKYYRPNGAIYIVTVKGFEDRLFLYREGTFAYIMPKDRSIDIDTEYDFRLAEFFMRG